ncbi:hypothetical protein Tco_0824395 [Tanacetum coccineum]|uniref:Uncharacterized protein n=1 Tax=Tanacetum coccineum TaxID=301880 RepID=A0ABQ5APL5_9ASTR
MLSTCGDFETFFAVVRNAPVAKRRLPNLSTRYSGWWLELSAKTPAHGATTTPWVAFSRLAPPPPAEMVSRGRRDAFGKEIEI